MSLALPPSIGLFLFLGTFFGLLAAACAFIISYEEYQHHFRGRREPVLLAARTALVAFPFFLLASFLVPLFLPFLSQ